MPEGSGLGGEGWAHQCCECSVTLVTPQQENPIVIYGEAVTGHTSALGEIHFVAYI